MKIHRSALLLVLGLSCSNLLHSQTPATGQDVSPPLAATTPEPNAEGIYEVGKGVTPPKLLSSTEPEYSAEARKKKITSDCLVGLIVDPDGHPKNIHVIRSAAEGQPAKKQDAARTLDQKAMDAIYTYTFSPAMLDGKPVPVSIRVDVQFRIFKDK